MRRSDPMLNALGSPCSPPRPGRCFVFLGRVGVVRPLIELCQENGISSGWMGHLARRYRIALWVRKLNGVSFQESARS